ncbi:TetR/AcrR family transcriptional regulator [Rhodococcus sp. 077-4]|uniref:TetR/AcrR family transcriptional regulator n=1 Tax=Rhodococcus sp. 077-4 TaxID=2789271 RepID=UPI0039F4F667
MNRSVSGTSSAAPTTRRERYREQTINEIKTLALAQVVEGGEAAVSLNAVAKQMAMSPGALYRYFDNRESLVSALVVEAFNALADHLEGVAATRSTAANRLRGLGRAYRAWALANPNLYRLIFETVSIAGPALASDGIVAASQRSMNLFLQVLADAAVRANLDLSVEFTEQAEAWGLRADRSELSASTLTMALLLWTRLHGLVSLEMGQHLQATGVTPGLLFDLELDLLVQMTGSSE